MSNLLILAICFGLCVFHIRFWEYSWARYWGFFTQNGNSNNVVLAPRRFPKVVGWMIVAFVLTSFSSMQEIAQSTEPDERSPVTLPDCGPHQGPFLQMDSQNRILATSCDGQTWQFVQ